MSDASGFGKFVPGFEFLQNLAGQAAGGVAQGLEKSMPQLPNLGNWVAPTFNVEDLEKRIEELKAVHFWLDQNAKALGATIQALEVQKMTLATLKSMNFSLGDVANALKIKAVDSMAGFTGTPPAPAPATTQFAGLEIPERTYGAHLVGLDLFPGDRVVACRHATQLRRDVARDGLHNFGDVVVAVGNEIHKFGLGAARGRPGDKQSRYVCFHRLRVKNRRLGLALQRHARRRKETHVRHKAGR